MPRKTEYKVGDRIFYKTYSEKEICTDIVKKVKEEAYLNDKGKEIPYKWLVLWESGNVSSGIEDYNCLSYNDPRVKEIIKKYKKFDKEKDNMVESVLKMLSPYDKSAQEEFVELVKTKLNIK